MHTLNKNVCENYEHVYHPIQEVIAGGYLEIASGDVVSKKHYLEPGVALNHPSRD